MSKIQCGGFNFDDSSFEMKTVNGQKVLGNKYGGVVMYKIVSENGFPPAIYVTYDELFEQLENGNFIIFSYKEEEENDSYIYLYFTSLTTYTDTKKKYLTVGSQELGSANEVFVYDEEHKYFILKGN